MKPKRYEAIMDSDSETPTYQRQGADINDRVEDLLDRMSLAEKAGQVTGTWGGTFREPHDMEDVKRAIREHHLGMAATFGWGSAFGREPREIANQVNELQRCAVEETQLGIPLLFNVDAVHGHAYVAGATVFPNGLGAAATWDPDTVERTATVTAREMRATGAVQNYSPTADVGREPRWGRVFETFGESPLLCGELAAAKVRGYQGSGLDDPESVMATAKHFPAYSKPERGEDASPVEASEYDLRNRFVSSFESTLDAGVESIMPSYNAIDGEPAHGSGRFLTGLLREELGFDGHIVSDWNGIRHLHEDHYTARDHADSVRQARNAGVDVASVGHTSHAERVVDLVESGDLEEEILNESVRRVLRVKFRAGLFEDPFVDPDTAAATLGTDAHRDIARDAARDSMTLLKNDDDLLPLDGDEDVFVGGPNADNLIHQLGGWSVHDAEGVPGATIYEAITDRCGGTVTYSQGTTLNETIDVDDAVENAADADVAVLALGEGWYLHEFGSAALAETETGDWPTRRELRLSEAQRDLVRRVYETGTPVIGVLVTGRPLIVDWMAEHVPALIMAYFPGTEGGVAVAETLFGDINPSGRLPITVPQSTADLPQTHDSLVHPTPIGDHVHPDSYDPLFAFGHGLSYTSFDHADLDATTDGESVTVSVAVSNEGNRRGTETVQVYARQAVASRVRPRRELVGFDRVDLEPNERTRVVIDVPKEKFGFYKPREGHVVEAGSYDLFVEDLTTSVTLE